MDKDKVVFIDKDYSELRRMWRDNRWKFSGELVRLTIKQSKGGLTSEDEHRLSTINRVINENDGKWTEGYDFDSSRPTIKKKK